MGTVNAAAAGHPAPRLHAPGQTAVAAGVVAAVVAVVVCHSFRLQLPMPFHCGPPRPVDPCAGPDRLRRGVERCGGRRHLLSPTVGTPWSTQRGHCTTDIARHPKLVPSTKTRRCNGDNPCSALTWRVTRSPGAQLSRSAYASTGGRGRDELTIGLWSFGRGSATARGSFPSFTRCSCIHPSPRSAGQSRYQTPDT
eukprot:gene10206-biopygen2891